MKHFSGFWIIISYYKKSYICFLNLSYIHSLSLLPTSFVTDGLSLSEMGLSLVNLPIQIIQDVQLQQQVMSTDIIPENSTAIYIPVDQNQVNQHYLLLV